MNKLLCLLIIVEGSALLKAMEVVPAQYKRAVKFEEYLKKKYRIISVKESSLINYMDHFPAEMKAYIGTFLFSFSCIPSHWYQKDTGNILFYNTSFASYVVNTIGPGTIHYPQTYNSARSLNKKDYLDCWSSNSILHSTDNTLIGRIDATPHVSKVYLQPIQLFFMKKNNCFSKVWCFDGPNEQSLMMIGVGNGEKSWMYVGKKVDAVGTLNLFADKSYLSKETQDIFACALHPYKKQFVYVEKEENDKNVNTICLWEALFYSVASSLARVCINTEVFKWKNSVRIPLKYEVKKIAFITDQTLSVITEKGRWYIVSLKPHKILYEQKVKDWNVCNGAVNTTFPYLLALLLQSKKYLFLTKVGFVDLRRIGSIIQFPATDDIKVFPTTLIWYQGNVLSLFNPLENKCVRIETTYFSSIKS